MSRLPHRLCILFATALTLVALAVTGARAHAETGQDYAVQSGARLLGQTAPALKLTTLDGQTIDLAALRGHKAVYLKFWATWCVPCREQMPHFEKTWRGAGDDLAVVA
ncbi:MAG: TlpA family protein disulfide reductase, partial [Gammaproteobacteria bacterium]